jgi:hypothetical protein
MDMYTNFKKVYISGPFTSVAKPAKILDFYERIGELCSRLGLIPYLPHHKTDPWNHPELSPKEVLFIDKSEVMTSALMIAYVGMPSHGVGMELAYADISKVPIVLLYEKGAKVSRIIRGIPTVVAEIAFSTQKEAISQLCEVIITLVQCEINFSNVDSFHQLKKRNALRIVADQLILNIHTSVKKLSVKPSKGRFVIT